MTLPRIHTLGDSALLCSLEPPATLAQQQRIWALAGLASGWAEVAEVVPGMNNLTLICRPIATDLAALSDRILAHWPRLEVSDKPGRLIEIPVSYGGEAGPDLCVIAEQTGLSAERVIALHSEAEYIVYFIGFMPGFPYLGGLPQALATSRRANPRLSIPAGSVGIGGAQTGIYPMASPGGWQLLGRTELPLFDPNQSPPTLLQPGDRVRFTVERIT